MKDYKKKPDITKKVQDDKQKIGDETKRAEGVVGDAKHVDTADKKIQLKGTEEGAKEIMKSCSKALESTKDVHKKLDDEQNKRFGEAKGVEKNLADRSDATKKDAKAIEQEKRGMKSKDTGDAQKEMGAAIKSAEGDVAFMKDAEGKEKDTRTKGESEMKKQTSTIKGFKTKRG